MENFWIVKEIEKEKNIIKKGKVKFEGEYLNGEKNENDKEYYGNDHLAFEG